MQYKQLITIAQQFADAVVSVTALGNGLINDTFLVSTASTRFVLQRVNTQVFSAPEQITANLRTLNSHLQQKKQLSPQLELPTLISSLAGQSHYCDKQGNYWRALSFITDSESLETLQSLANAEQVGFALGHFHRLFSDLKPCDLYDTLPDFHITPNYLQQYQRVMQQTTAATDEYCTAFIAQYQHIAGELEDAKQQGLLSLRVIHGDPKLNNFLFDRRSKKIISLIDLDTVKPALVHYDIGDCLRSCCHIAATDEFDLPYCGAILKSYLAEAGMFFNEHDYAYLYSAIRLIPFELGLRFYTDYLHGNCYFKVTAPEQNCHRATKQFRLCESIMAQEAAIKRLLAELQPTPC